MTIRPFYCRIGSKKKLLNKILPLIPEHKIYVEPFMGSSAVFWAKEPAEYTILNDLDKSLVDDYKLILKTPTPSRPITRKFIKTRTFVNNFYNNLTNSPIDKLIKRLMLRCNTFCSKTFNENEKVILYNRGNPYSKINKLDEYKERLKGVKILNQSYEKIIKKYDSPDTFFYLDPPYENSEGLYTESQIDYEEMWRILDKVKGKWLLSINDSPRIRNTFKGYLYKKISVGGTNDGRNGIGNANRNELLISNYEP